MIVLWQLDAASVKRYGNDSPQHARQRSPFENTVMIFSPLVIKECFVVDDNVALAASLLFELLTDSTLELLNERDVALAASDHDVLRWEDDQLTWARAGDRC